MFATRLAQGYCSPTETWFTRSLPPITPIQLRQLWNWLGIMGFEFQRLHGMGEGLYDLLLKEYQIPCRIYAPVGEHENLLSLPSDGCCWKMANTSFVNNIVDDQVPIAELIQDPVAKVKSWVQKANPQIPLPGIFMGQSAAIRAGWI